jgi:hypothetical protein
MHLLLDVPGVESLVPEHMVLKSFAGFIKAITIAAIETSGTPLSND